MTKGWLRRHRILLGSLAGGLVLLLVVTVGSGYLMLRHFNNNITQGNLTALVGKQPANPAPLSENILVIGSDDGLAAADGDVTTDQPDTLMLLHIAADRKSAQVMSIPRASWVNIPSCETGNGETTALTQSRIGNAYAIDGQKQDHAVLGAGCLVKTLEQDTGIYIGHFIVVSLAGFQSMVAALGGVDQCVPAGLTDPNSGTVLTPGCRLLAPAQALAYVRARTGTGADYINDDLDRIAREQSLVSSLFKRAQTKLLNPLAIYRFVDAASKSLTIDTGLGGITGLYRLEQTLHAIPSADVTQFTLPITPGPKATATHPQEVTWKQPQASKIFAAIRADQPVSSALFK